MIVLTSSNNFVLAVYRLGFTSVFVLLFGAFNLLQAQVAMNASTRRYVQAASFAAKSSDQAQRLVTQVGYPFVDVSGQPYLELFVRASSDFQASSIQATAVCVVGNLYALRVPVRQVPLLVSHASVQAVEVGLWMTPTTDVSVVEIGATRVHAGEDGLQPLTGKGVVVGVFDTGIDATSTDFMSNGVSRLLSLWDMSDPSTDNAPAGFNWGREYKRTDITSSTPIVQVDRSGHGSHVAGIAAGSGIATVGTRGVAPEADLIIVKGIRADRARAGFSDLDIVAGCQYIFNQARALGKPCVINLSLGSPIGPHDGSSLFEQQLSALVGPGAIIVVAAGNDGSLPIHAGTETMAGEAVETLISPINLCNIFDNFCPPIPNFVMTAADIWFTSGSVDSVFITAYGQDNNALTPLKTLGYSLSDARNNQPVVVSEAGTIAGFLNMATSNDAHPKGDGNISLQIHNGGDANLDITSRFWSIGFKGSKAGRIDLWAGIPIPAAFGVQGALGKPFFGDNLMTCGTPGTAEDIVSVGSYVTTNSWTSEAGPKTSPSELGSISSFSSLGPTRDGRRSPVVTAPGEMIGSTRSRDLADYSSMNSPDNRIPTRDVVMAQGTSMAAPHVAGVVALLLQARPLLTYSSLVGILQRTSRSDAFATPDFTTWGFGKISAAAAVRDVLTSVVDESPTHSVVAWPNPASAFVTISNALANAAITMIDIHGSMVSLEPAEQSGTSVVLDVRALSSGMWQLVETDQSGNRRTTPILILR